MAWWKIGLLGTLIWLIGVGAVGAVIVTKIMKDHPFQQEAANLRSQEAGQAVGAIAAPLLCAIWFFAWRRKPRNPVVSIERPPRLPKGGGNSPKGSPGRRLGGGN